jgi:prepilin-type N-terminal cleavage/methylation domain-containing protein
MTRRGFTLIEVSVALVVTGVVVLLAYGVARAGMDTEARLARGDADARASLAARALLHDALRHAADGASDVDTVFALDAATDARGRRVDRLRFLSYGVVPPLGAGPRWAVSAAVVPVGLELLAVPTDARAGAAVRVLVPGVASLRVQALASDGEWADTWARAQSAPTGVRVVFGDSAGRPVGPALVARTRPEGW